MKIKTKLSLSVSFIIASFLCVILLISFSLMRVLHYKDDVGLAMSTYAKWSVLNNNTKVLLMADKNINDAFENWRSSLRDFTEQHELLVGSKRIRAMGYEMEGILQQSQGLWGFYRIIVDQVIDILDTDEGKLIFATLESNHLSIVTAAERGQTLGIDPKIMQDIRKIRENLKFTRNTSAGSNEATQTSAENDFNWLWNNSFIPLLETEIRNQVTHIMYTSIVVAFLIIVAAIFITITIVRSITGPLNQFLNVYMEGARGNLSVRFPLKRKFCSQIITCLDKKCVAFENLDVLCFVEIGSYATVLNKKVTCPHILAGEVRECGECMVYHRICKEEMLMAGAWFNVLMGNLDRSVKIIRDAQLIWQKSMAMTPQVQRSLYPQKTAAIDPWDAVSYFKTASGVSGNFHDMYIIDNQLKGVGLFNVAGHGISVALMTVISKSLIFRLFGRMHNAPLNKVLKNASDALSQETGKNEHYLTGILIRTHDDHLECCNAGLPNILIKDSQENTVRELSVPQSTINGSIATAGDAAGDVQIQNVAMAENDFVVLHTIGLLKVKNARGELFGIERLKDSMSRAPAGTSQTIMEFIIQELHSFAGQSELSDDIAAIILKKK